MTEMDLSSMTLARLIREQPEFVENRIRFLLDERRQLQKELKRARSALRYVAETCTENPFLVEFAKRASRDLLTEEEPKDGKKRGLDREGA